MGSTSWKLRSLGTSPINAFWRCHSHTRETVRRDTWVLHLLLLSTYCVTSASSGAGQVGYVLGKQHCGAGQVGMLQKHHHLSAMGLEMFGDIWCIAGKVWGMNTNFCVPVVGPESLSSMLHRTSIALAVFTGWSELYNSCYSNSVWYEWASKGFLVQLSALTWPKRATYH